MDKRITEGLVQSLSRLWQKHEFEDFKVIVEDDTFTCHSVILAGVSEFFAGLLRSNMKEQNEMEVRVMGVSSSTFQLILDTIYTGSNLLTNKNVCDVWSAVHQLQIPFLIEHCEDFVLKTLSLETIDRYKQRAEYLQSEKICEGVFNFMLTNFESLRTTKIFKELDFRNLTKLISDDKLVINSEDSVLQAIFDWVGYGNVCKEAVNVIQPLVELKANDLSLKKNKDSLDSLKPEKESSSESECLHLNSNLITNGQTTVSLLNEKYPNERKKLLISLLNSTRFYLANDTCIVKLYNSSLIENDLLVKELLFKALTFKLSDNMHGYWPTIAVYRESSDVEHVGVLCCQGKNHAVTLKKQQLFTIKNLPIELEAKVIVFRTKLYACSTGSDKNEVFVFHKSVWTLVTEIPHDVLIILSHDKYIYVFDSHEERFTRFDPDILPIQLETFQHEILNISYALSFNNNIVVFASVDNNGEEDTAVHCWNSETKVWTQLDNLKLSSRNLTSFRDDCNSYILDSNGILYSLTNKDAIGFKLHGNIWTGNVKLLGALLFRQTLHILVQSETENLGLTLVKHDLEMISSTFKWRSSQKTDFVHYVIPKKELKPAS